MSIIDAIQHEHQFKVLGDGLLRFELGPLVQTYAAVGRDGGIDAEFHGPLAGTEGRWVFQYKFRSQQAALNARRQWLVRRYTSSNPCEFEKDGVVGADGYVLLTNVPVTAGNVKQMRARWVACGHAEATFCVWDPSALSAMLRGRESLARTWSGAPEQRCFNEIVTPLWRYVGEALPALLVFAEHPLWPLNIATERERAEESGFGVIPKLAWRITFATDGGALQLVQEDRQYSYASRVVFPVALEPVAEASRAVSTLAARLRRHLGVAAEDIRERLSGLTAIPSASDREDVLKGLAYVVLGSRWGMIHALLTDDEFSVQGGTFNIYKGPGLESVVDMNALFGDRQKLT